MGRAWSMRTYQEGDEDQIFGLVKAVGGDNLPGKEQWLRGWKWMFFDNPAGTPVIWLAEDNGRPVSQYPVILENMVIEGQIMKGAQLVDTMTHPEYRRQGIASALGEKALCEVEKEGICLVYCFPSQQIYPLHMRSGWLDVCAFQLMIRPLDIEKLLQAYLTQNEFLLKLLALGGKLVIKAFLGTRKLPEVDGLTISKVSQFDDRFDDFWNKVSNNYKIIVVRDRRYLNWRYVNAPNTKYTIYAAEKEGEVCGYTVLGLRSNNGLLLGNIYDLVAPLSQDKIIQHLISKAVEHFQEEKVDAIVSQMIANKVYRKALSKNGFIPLLGSRSRFIVYNASHKVDQGFIKNSRNWFIQLGDLPLIY